VCEAGGDGHNGGQPAREAAAAPILSPVRRTLPAQWTVREAGGSSGGGGGGSGGGGDDVA